MWLIRFRHSLRQTAKAVKFLLSVRPIYYIVSFLLVPLFLNLPSLIYKFWQEVPLVSKVPIISYALIIWLAITMLLFFVWVFKQFARLTILRRTISAGSLTGMTILPGLILLCYFCAVMLVNK